MSELKLQTDPKIYLNFADILTYPEKDYLDHIKELEDHLSETGSSAHSHINQFYLSVKEFSLYDLQELYTRTFDLMSVCTPYIGIHLFGEDNFKRGNLMAKLNDEYSHRGLTVEKELPDHIAVLFRFLAIADEDENNDAFEFLLKKPIEYLVNNLKETENPYLQIFKALQLIVDQEIGEEG